jgi:hypothetical protein
VLKGIRSRSRVHSNFSHDFSVVVDAVGVVDVGYGGVVEVEVQVEGESIRAKD